MPEAGETERVLLEALFAGAPVGFLLLDTQLRVVRCNQAAADMRGLPEGDVMSRVPPEFASGFMRDDLRDLAASVLETGSPVLNRLVRGHASADSTAEATFSVTLFRLHDSTGRVLGLAGLVEDVSLREAAVTRLAILDKAFRRIGGTLDVTGTAWELAEVAVPDLADGVIVDVLDDAYRGRRLPTGSLDPNSVLRRAAHRSVDDTDHTVDLGALFALPSHTPYSRSLADLRPRLVAHLDADEPWFAADPERTRRAVERGVHSLLVTPLKAQDTVLGVAVYYRHRRPAAFGPDDLRLAEELASRTALHLDKAHSYRRERTIAQTLQRYLRPSARPETSAVETAVLHVEGDEGADWFDVIPLSGARVALTAGTVAGRGIEAAAAMGQLRAAVQTLAAQDMAPDELLTGLDDAFVRLGQDTGGAGGTDEPPHPTTCLYLVYDPVSSECTVSLAGYPEPILLAPDGSGIAPDLPPGPALGRGGGYESVTLKLDPGSLIGLYSRGLLTHGSGVEEAGSPDLASILGRAGVDLAQLCDDVAYRLASDTTRDDVSLLLARTRVLDPDNVAVWPLSEDPREVARARALCAAQLTAWGLDGLADTTELIVSELVTNAIRYGTPPMTLRLLFDRELLCEVSDSSSTTPHMRLATDTDEGGRGLFLVMHVSSRWGTRFAARGKTIWSAQELPP
ncbi:SpoIIE family protein phosphatase [Streptomyces sp. NRRL B-24572]|uniref:SpoIIE family protein phosphatase n=1 Tax=Streptomyces sp. NRRL B-24572 TaxID=1962156 RepID=UPI000A3BF5BD|nr:SpoIIE family protein phosphatase [Streptomyces sp. NRRL B-24572]